MLSAARRGLSAACCVFLSAAGLAVTGPLSTTPAFAAATSEVAVIPPVQPDQLVTERMVVAGKTGFLHQHTATSAWLWTRYADGITATVPELANIDATNLTGAGGDSVRILTVVPGRTVDGTLTIFDLSTKTWRHPALPTGNIVRFHAYFDDTMLLFTGGGLSGGPELRRFAPDGSWTTIPVTGAPAGTGTFSRFPTAAEPNGMVLLLRGTTDGVAWSRYGLLDFRSGHLSLVPPVTGVLQVLLSDTHLGFRTLSGSVLVFDRAAITAGTAETPVTVPISGAAPASAEVSLLGGDVLTVNPGRDSRAVLHSATGEPRTILPSTQDGSYSWLRTGDAALVVGGTGPRDWAVHRITPGGSEPILPVTEAVTPSGLTLSRGLLRRVVSTSRFAETPRYRFVNHRLAENPGNPISGGTPATANTCTPGATCLRTVDGNAIGTAYLDSGATSSRLTYLAEAGNAVWSTVLPAGGATIVDSSVHHTIVNTTTPPRQYIVRALGTEAPEVRAISGAALWQDTLWTAGAGRLQPRNLSWRTTGAAAPTGSACTATELQATQRHVYWACGGSGPAGVYDLVRKVNVPVPAGQYLLGDGFLTRHDGATGDLLRYDLTARERSALRWSRGRSPPAGFPTIGTSPGRSTNTAVTSHTSTAPAPCTSSIRVYGVRRCPPPSRTALGAWSSTITEPVFRTST